MIPSALERWLLRRKLRRVDRLEVGRPALAQLKVLLVANGLIPSLSLQFVRPLAALTDSDQVAISLLSEQELLTLFGKPPDDAKASRWIAKRFNEFRPDIVVFCRYSGPHAPTVLRQARLMGAATVLQLDDDLLHVPREFGEAKYAFHNAPERLGTIRTLLADVDLVSFSNQALAERFAGETVGGRRFVPEVFSASDVIRGHPEGAEVKIGYMGIDHARDLEIAVPALAAILERNPAVVFELFGPMAMPDGLLRFGDRARSLPPVRGYDAFLEKFSSLGWSIGICPLVDSEFNRVKTDLKWVEYTANGIAVVASRGIIYDECCAGGCGLLAADGAEWEAALQGLVSDPAARRHMVETAQARLARQHSIAAQRKAVLGMLAQVHEKALKFAF